MRCGPRTDKLNKMKSGYDQFFKNARKAAPQGKPLAPASKGPTKSAKPQRQFSTSQANFELSDEDLEQQLKLRLGMPSKTKKRRRKTIPWKMMGVAFLGVLATAWGYQNLELVESTLKRVEISYLGTAMAEPKAAAETKKSDSKEADAKKSGADKGTDKKAAAETEAGKSGNAETSGTAATAAGDDTIDHLSKLNERKKELDEKEEELGRAEQELQAQKEELEKRLKDLEGMRRGISSVLEEKVKVDEKKLDTLVLIYSDMKAQQAAKVFETMDEDLAVGILGRMKKKNAADIMTLLKADKAQALTEKFAGYKRK